MAKPIKANISMDAKPVYGALQKLNRGRIKNAGQMVAVAASLVTDQIIKGTDIARKSDIDNRLKRVISTFSILKRTKRGKLKKRQVSKNGAKWKGTEGARIFLHVMKKRGKEYKGAMYYNRVDGWYRRKVASIGYHKRGWIPAKKLFNSKVRIPRKRAKPHGSARLNRGFNDMAFAEGANWSENLKKRQPNLAAAAISKSRTASKKQMQRKMRQFSKQAGF